MGKDNPNKEKLTTFSIIQSKLDDISLIEDDKDRIQKLTHFFRTGEKTPTIAFVMAEIDGKEELLCAFVIPGKKFNYSNNLCSQCNLDRNETHTNPQDRKCDYQIKERCIYCLEDHNSFKCPQKYDWAKSTVFFTDPNGMPKITYGKMIKEDDVNVHIDTLIKSLLI